MGFNVIDSLDAGSLFFISFSDGEYLRIINLIYFILTLIIFIITKPPSYIKGETQA